MDEGESGMVKQFAVIGDPVEHSLSPVIHAAAYEFLGFDWRYSAVKVAKGELKDFIESTDFQGLSVTMPLKEELLAVALDKHWFADQNSLAMASANTLVLDEQKGSVANTDVFGAYRALDAVDPLQISSLAILGSGATSRSCALAALTKFDLLQRCVVFSRSRERAAKLLDLISASKPEVELQWLPLDAAEDFGGSALTINTLPAEVAQTIDVDRPLSAGWVFDVNYRSFTQRPSIMWTENHRVPGIDMLIWQAIAQIRLFAGLDSNESLTNEAGLYAAMRRAVE